MLNLGLSPLSKEHWAKNNSLEKIKKGKMSVVLQLCYCRVRLDTTEN